MVERNYPALRETVWHTVLPNGLNVYVDTRPEYGKQFAFFATRYGGMDLRFRGEDASWIDTPQGVAHFLEHKMFDTKDGSALQRMAAQGVDPNAYTTPWMTGYFFEGTQGFEDNLRTLLKSTPLVPLMPVAASMAIIRPQLRRKLPLLMESDTFIIAVAFVVLSSAMNLALNITPRYNWATGIMAALALWKGARTCIPGLNKRRVTAAAWLCLPCTMVPICAALHAQHALWLESNAIEAEMMPSERLPLGLPSQLLERRPDLRSAELNLKAAMAGVGVAYADRFPKLTFNLQGGWENNELADFFKSPFSYIAGSLVGPIFDFGRKQGKYREAIAAYEQSRLKYEQQVLTAFKEVDDAVVTYRKLRQATSLKTHSRNAAKKYVDLAQLQYRAGSINYIEVLDAQRRHFDAQLSLSNALRDENLALVQLYKALGGGWQ